jgi:hypothetical protein
MTELLAAYRKLQRRASVTSSARFNASTRILKRGSFSIWAVSLMSVYLLMLSLLPLIVPKISETYSAPINAINAGLSLMLLVFSIIESMRDHGRTAQMCYDGGLRVRELQNAVSIAIASGALDVAELRKYQGEYDRILRETGVNHLEIDVLLVELTKGVARDSSTDRQIGFFAMLVRRLSYLRLWVAQFILYWVCMIGPLLVVWLVGYLQSHSFNT